MERARAATTADARNKLSTTLNFGGFSVAARATDSMVMAATAAP